jgi:pilus assembly protein Flp/PilA
VQCASFYAVTALDECHSSSRDGSLLLSDSGGCSYPKRTKRLPAPVLSRISSNRPPPHIRSGFHERELRSKRVREFYSALTAGSNDSARGLYNINFGQIKGFKTEEYMIKEFIQDEQGQDIVEYSLLLVLIGAAALFVLTAMGASITSIFSKINVRLTTANNSIS